MSDGWLFPHPGEDIGAFLARARPSITSSLVAHWISVNCKERRETDHKAAGGKCIPNCEICKSGDSDAFVGGDDDFVTIEDESGGGKIRMGCLSRLQNVVEEYRANVLAVTKAVPKAKKTRLVHTLYHVAAADGLTVGKWMLFVSSDSVDEVWAKVARATVAGRLGVAAKVATRTPGSDSHLICMPHPGGAHRTAPAGTCSMLAAGVYCQDFTDARDCQRVLKELFRMGFNVRAAFKPDFYTYLGINSAEAGELKIKEDWLLHRDILKAVQNGGEVYPDDNDDGEAPAEEEGSQGAAPGLKFVPAARGELRFDQFGFGRKVLEKRRQEDTQGKKAKKR